MKDPKEIFNCYCKSHGMRCTPERYIIIDEIFRIRGHFNIDELYLRIRKDYPHKKLSKGSIYRTIPHLVKAGLLRECFIDQGHSCYESALGAHHHEHLKCVRCGKILEFSSPRINTIEKNICKKLKFHMIEHSHVLLGYCVDCQADLPKKGVS